MTRAIIGTVLRNLPALLFAIALVMAFVHRRDPVSERMLVWILLLPIGVTGLWAGMFHVLFPAVSAR